MSASVLKKTFKILFICIISIFLTIIFSRFIFKDFFKCINDSIAEFIYSKSIIRETVGNSKYNIAIVDIDFESCQLYKRVPNNRDIANIAEKIYEGGAKCILLDISMDYKQNEEDDSIAAFIFSNIKNIGLTGILVKSNNRSDILGINLETISNFTLNLSQSDLIEKWDYEYVSLPLNCYLKNATFFGFVNVIYDRSNRITNIPLLFNHKDKIYPSALLSCFAFIKNKHPKDMILKKNSLNIENDFIPLDNNGILLPPKLENNCITRIPYFKFPYINNNIFKDQIVFIGRSYNFTDYHMLKSGHLMFGTEIFANSLLNMLNGNFFHYIKNIYILIIAFINCIIICWLAFSRFHLTSNIYFLICNILIVIIAINLFAFNLILNPFEIILSSTFCLLISYVYRCVINK